MLRVTFSLLAIKFSKRKCLPPFESGENVS
jgi:hypothetical protein